MNALSKLTGWWLCLFTSLSFGAQAQEGTAALRLAHLSPDAPRIDLLIDGELRLTDLSFSRFSGYLRLPPGEHEVQVFPHRLPRRSEPDRGATNQDAAASGGAAETDQPVQETDAPAPRRLEPVTTLVTLDKGESYTLALVGFYEPPPPGRESGSLTLNVVPEDSRVEVTGPDGYAATLTASDTVRELRPGVYSLAVGREGYQPSRYDVEVQPGLTSVATVTLQRGEAEAEEPPPQVVPGQGNVWHKVELQLYSDPTGLVSEPSQAFVRIVHTSPTTQAADASLESLSQDSETHALALTTGLTFPNGGDETAVPAGAYDLRFDLTNTDYTLTTLSGLRLEPDLLYTFYLIGTPGDEHVQVIPDVDALAR